ncbi:A/G-specific adenine glycosylase [Pajaroellobacter abortibovis]|uniref:Adenine DNA glycosylase n=1 Tax=Pajaroellobacter abortibovis TaxID=1882918 RepID=A0A1L6MX04_9BACT|nr:A/G-specific adenine glycosylase [Pajaroellobacter abortibovis]APR99965.1 A/G-specific adenine glycosylase [Pajaroellobacter abortibovis]
MKKSVAEKGVGSFTQGSCAENVSPEMISSLHGLLLAWYSTACRDLPWRKTNDPYAVWLSEVMLQQTRVETVIPYWKRFMDAFPTIQALAEASLESVLTLWSGLGYYRRAQSLHRTAQQVCSHYAGLFPQTVRELCALDGIGAYTAGAIASIAYQQPAPLVDGNVARVFARIFAIREDVRQKDGLKQVWKLAETLVSSDQPGEWNQAVMELGSLICVPREPKCLLCPVSAVCEARIIGLERQLPIQLSKPKPTIEQRIAFVLVRDGHVLLGQRWRGINAGLWEPPMISMETSSSERVENQKAVLRQSFGIHARQLCRVNSISHILTHRRLEVEIWRGETVKALKDEWKQDIYQTLKWVSLNAFEYCPLSMLSRKILRAAGISHRAQSPVDLS